MSAIQSADPYCPWKTHGPELMVKLAQVRELLEESLNSLELMRREGAAWDDCMARAAKARAFLASGES